MFVMMMNTILKMRDILNEYYFSWTWASFIFYFRADEIYAIFVK